MMRLYFRPIPGLSVAAAIVFALLIGLGVWQIERLHWKLNLIATVDARMQAPPVPLSHALAMGMAKAEYRHVEMTGHFDNTREALVYMLGPEGQPGYHILTPFVLAGQGGKAVMIDRGFIPRDKKPVSTRTAGELAGTRLVVGVLRRSYAPGLFTPPPDLKQHEWFVRDAPAIARTVGVSLIAPVVIEADATPNPGGWPRGGQTVVHFRNEHLQYAITWFALAAGLVLVYLAYHRSRGRLGIRD